jgi:Mg2+/Co2+ transporter CorB
MEDVIEEIVGQEIIDESDKAKDMRELARSRNIASRKNFKKTGTRAPENPKESTPSGL